MAWRSWHRGWTRRSGTPTLAAQFLAEHPDFNVLRSLVSLRWFTEDLFVLTAGVVEVTIGILLISGVLTRVVILGMWLPFNIGVPFLPPQELIGASAHLRDHVLPAGRQRPDRARRIAGPRPTAGGARARAGASWSGSASAVPGLRRCAPVEEELVCRVTHDTWTGLANLTLMTESAERHLRQEVEVDVAARLRRTTGRDWFQASGES